MGKDSAIGWCDDTFNPWIGCARVGPECDDCYAAVSTPARAFGVTWGAHTTRHITSVAKWREPLAWHCDPIRDGRRRRVFCASLADVFEDRRDLDLPRAWLWAVIEHTPDLDWLLLTKRPAKVPRLVPAAWMTAWPAHAWIGTSVGCTASLPQLAHLRAIPAPVRFLSCEPLLEALPALDLTGIGWVIVGGKSGAQWRTQPMAVAWLVDVVAQCDAAAVPVFVKQDHGPVPGLQGRIPNRVWCRKEHPHRTIPAAESTVLLFAE
jgi:protein gp37